MRFYVGMFHLHHVRHVERAFISVNQLRRRRSDFTPPPGGWVLDSGAFTEISTHGRYRHDVEHYAAEIRRWQRVPGLHAAVAQDWMCEPWILARTGLSVAEHQRRTIERYDRLRDCVDGVYVMPVLQGYAPEEYVAHLHQYGDRFAPGAWVGVGSICKRNADPSAIYAVLAAIHAQRPDLQLHGFGVKRTALRASVIRDHLASADSMAWSFAARKQGRSPNDWREALAFAETLSRAPSQLPLI